MISGYFISIISLYTLYMKKAMPGITDMAFHFNYEEIFALQFDYDYPPRL